MVKSSFIRRFNTDVKMLHDSGITAKAGACIMVILLSVGVASADRLETVDSPGQSLRGGECTYTLVEAGEGCPRDKKYHGQYCCQDSTTKACVLSDYFAMAKPCPVNLTTFCIHCYRENWPANTSSVESVRLIDTTGKMHPRNDLMSKCVMRGIAPFQGCGDSQLHQAEIQCCLNADTNEKKDCLPWTDTQPCFMTHPAAFCVVCGREDFTAMEFATLFLAAFGCLGTLIAVVQTKLAKKLMNCMLGCCGRPPLEDDRIYQLHLQPVPAHIIPSTAHVEIKVNAAPSAASSSMDSTSHSSSSSSQNTSPRSLEKPPHLKV